VGRELLPKTSAELDEQPGFTPAVAAPCRLPQLARQAIAELAAALRGLFSTNEHVGARTGCQADHRSDGRDG